MFDGRAVSSHGSLGIIKKPRCWTSKRRLAFEELSQLITQRKAASQNNGVDFLIAEILLNEAKAKINGKPDQ